MSEVWSLTKIGDCCDILDNLRVPLNAEEREGMQGDIPYYGANGLQGYIDNFIFDEPLILLAEDGGYFDEYETRPIAYRISGKSWVNNHAHILRVKAGYPFCQDFIFYSLQHKNITPFIKGGTRAKLNQRELREILIPTPPRALQRHIAEILSTLDGAIEQTEALIAKMQQVKAGLMHDLFTRGVTPDGHLRPTQEQAPELYKESPLGWIPKAWDVKSLRQVATYQHGRPFPSTDYSDEGVLLLRPGNLHVSGIVRWDASHTTRIPEQWLREYPEDVLRHDDIVMNLTAQSLEDQFLGRVCIEQAAEPALLNQRIARFQTNQIHHHFLYWLLRSCQFRKQIDRTTQGTKVQHIYNSDLNRVVLAIPAARQEQEDIAEKLRAITELLVCSEDDAKKYCQQKIGLMKDLLTDMCG